MLLINRLKHHSYQCIMFHGYENRKKDVVPFFMIFLMWLYVKIKANCSASRITMCVDIEHQELFKIQRFK